VRQLLAGLVVFLVVAFSRTAFAGYTHYWTWLKPPDAARVATCLGEIEKVVRARPDLVADMNGATGADAKFHVSLPTRPDAGAPREAIVFNGIGAQAHEPFNFPGGPIFNFTKTLGKPYDAVVTAALIVARTCFASDELQIESDGNWEQWSEGRQLYAKTFGKDPPNVFVGDGGGSAPSAPKSWLLLGGLIAVSVIAWILARSRRPT
jgi:hypothetical protein